MTIAQRLYGLIFAAVIGFISLLSVSIFQMNKVYSSANYGTVNIVPSLLALEQANNNFGLMNIRLWQYMALKDPDTKKSVLDEISTLDRKILDPMDLYEKKYISDDKDRDLLRTDRDGISAFLVMRAKVMALEIEGKSEQARDLVLSNRSLGSKVRADFEAHQNYNMQLSNQNEVDAAHTLNQARWQEILIAILVTIIIVVMGLMVKIRVTRSLNEAILIAQTVASGDLSTQINITAHDEFRALLQALKDMNDNLFKMVDQVTTSTASISTSSNEIAAGNMDLSSRTESQASSLEETAASMQQLTSTVRQNADNARQANQLAQTATDIAIRGGEVVAKVIGTMEEINDSSRRIVDIISVIDGIAFQTNILALNAAVEAARAGEQGRGFAVVASEVRNLAQRAAAAAKEIKELINTSVAKVETGNALVNDAGSTMREVVGSIQRVTDIMSEITAASSEQSSGISQVNDAVIQMDSVTQQNAALVEQAAAAAASMQDQAAKLSELISMFILTAGPSRTAAPAARVIQGNPKSVVKKLSYPTSAVHALKTKTTSAFGVKSSSASVTADDWEEF